VLERHRGAQRDTKPAWMTSGVGIGTAILGESKGDLVKPGMTKSDLERIEKRVITDDDPDPFRDVFNERTSGGSGASPRGPPKRAALPPQDAVFSSDTPSTRF